MNSKLNANPFIGKTRTTPRPTRETYRGPDEWLTRDQERWDAAEAQRLDNQRLFEERVASVDTRRQAAQDERAREAEERRVAAAKASFIAAGGREADWPAAQPRVLAAVAERAAIDALAGAPHRERQALVRAGDYGI